MAPGASVGMVNGLRAANGFEPVDGFAVEHSDGQSSLKQRKKAAGNNEEDQDEDFDVEIPGHHAMSKRPVELEADSKLRKPHLPRANLAVTKECPFGTQTNNWAKQHKNYSTMEQHCLFFDPDADGIIWPLDTFRGLWKLGYPVWLIVFATVVIHAGFSWFSSDAWILPDPLLRLKVKQIHRSKHGSDTHTFDQEGRFHPQLFENIFTKFDRENKGGLTFMDGIRMIHGNRVVADFAGYLAGFIEWLLTYYLVAKKSDQNQWIVSKDDMRKVYDGSIFFEMTNTVDNHPVDRTDNKLTSLKERVMT